MIVVSQVTKTLGEDGERTAAINDVSFTVENGTIFTLLGPSGSGKTTMLRCVAGIETPDRGEIALGDTVVYSSARQINLPPNRRRIGMVFQSYAIWPHMTVAGNVAYPLVGRGLERSVIAERVERALTQVGLQGLADRDAPNLSGGQQQRVALARAIVDEADTLLLDEPLSNLDAKLRWQMRQELVALQERLGLTVLYVTHDQEEALALSHRIAVMRDGQIVEAGEPLALFEQPTSRYSAEFMGLANFLPCSVASDARPGERAAAQTAFGTFVGRVCASEGQTPELFFRPHRITLLSGEFDAGTSDTGAGIVSAVSHLGEVNDVTIRSGEQSARLRLRSSSIPRVGESIRFRLEPGCAMIFVPQRVAV